MNSWKPSRFNITTQAADKTIILFNTASGSMLYFPAGQYFNEIAPLLRTGRSEIDNDIWFEKLVRMGFLRQANHNELASIKEKYIQSQYEGQRQSITIIPSQACNFDCEYCFEKERTGQMSLQTAQQTLDFLQGWIYPHTKVSLCWYGGEPLLALEVIKFLSNGLQQIISSKDCKISSSMITNGYLLDEFAINTLLKCGLQTVQITIDGDPASHNRYRKLYNGKETYQTVFNNLVRAARSGLWINLRMNIGKHNYNQAFTLLHQLADTGVQSHISVSIGQLDDLCGNSPEAANLAVPSRKLAELEYRKYSHLISLGFPVNWNLSPRPTYCSAVKTSFILITHDGSIAKCWNQAGNLLNPIGHVNNSGLKDKMDPFILWDPLKNITCNSCAYLPLCMGGCPNQAMIHGHPNCALQRFYLKKVLRLHYMCQRTGIIKKPSA